MQQTKDQYGNVICYDDEGMMATLALKQRSDDMPYTVKELKEILKNAGVKSGIKEDVLQTMLETEKYGVPTTVATGKLPVDGEDGWFEFLFNTEVNVIPKENDDGSVDYKDVCIFEVVQKNQKVCVYHKFTGGTAGYTVTGQILMPKKGKDLPPIKGANLRMSEDGIEYFSNIDGKIEYKNGRIEISNVLEIKGDVDLSTGNIDYRGDVIIKGAVRSGMTVHAGGTLTISGIVESAELSSDKGILLRSGVVGGNQCQITCEGDIVGKFIESSRVFAKGQVQCSYLLNSDVTGRAGVVVEGRKATIIGGRTRSFSFVKSNNVGNDVEVPTVIQVGVDTAFFSRLSDLQKLKEELETKIQVFEERVHTEFDAPDYDDMVAELCKAVDQKVEVSEKITEMRTTLSQAKDSYITVLGSVYPNTTLQIDTVATTLTKKADHVTFRNRDNLVRAFTI
ncbi:MAG: FapA family protein [Lachnospiraceae bacterium]|nr:FapA family protein [Lachnospiraceae bacterium]